MSVYFLKVILSTFYFILNDITLRLNEKNLAFTMTGTLNLRRFLSTSTNTTKTKT